MSQEDISRLIYSLCFIWRATEGHWVVTAKYSMAGFAFWSHHW